jgi:uncharacterized protein YprB with RNaseH-like and TPR domain
MMNPSTLRDRLRGIIGTPGRAVQVPEPSLAPCPESAHSLGSSAEEVLGGTWREAAGGRSFVVRRRFLPDERYGTQSIGAFAARLERASDAARTLGVDGRCPLVFFDLETTGLSGGAGTHAFLVGCGWFDEEGAFITEQHLMTDYAGERGMLSVVADDLRRTGTLVTFNGKSFDAPVIETRYLFHRRESPCAQLPHLDVLHPARRFWGGASESGCSLTALESQVLGIRRIDDVPGFEIPARYFQFIRSGDARPLSAVLEHNRLDLISLAGLTARLVYLVEAGPGATDAIGEVFALGRVYARSGLGWRAEDAYERTIALSGSAPELSPIKAEALRILAVEARRARRYEQAAERWRQLLEMPHGPRHFVREAIEALAIHHEHRARDLTAAKAFALRGVELEAEPAWGDAARHRLARIERKMVSERRPLFPSSPSQPSSGSPTSARRTSS